MKKGIYLGLFVLVAIVIGVYLTRPLFFENQLKKLAYYSTLSKLQTIEIQLSKKTEKRLYNDRDSIYSLISKDNSSWGYGEKKTSYKCYIAQNDFEYKAKLYIAGHYQDHLKTPFSLKVRFDNGNFEGVSHFNLLNPLTRFLNVDIVANYFLKHFDVKTLKTFPIRVNLDGEENVYLFEEGFSSVSLNNKNGWVLEESSDSNPYFISRKSSIKPTTFCEALNNSNQLDTLLNYDKFALFYALGDLFQSAHQNFNINRHYYLDVRSNKIEPLGREFWFDSNTEYDLFIDQVENDTVQYEGIIKELFANKEFVDLYFKYLDKISKPDLIDQVFGTNSKALTQMQKVYWMNYAWYPAKISKEAILKNQEVIRNKIIAQKNVANH